MKPARRLFFALWPPAGLATALHAGAAELQLRWGGRVMRGDTLHLTLAVLGQVAEADLAALSALAAGIAAENFHLHITQMAYWEHNRIVYAGFAPNPGLDRLAARLRQACVDNGFLEAAAGFFPHLTLLRQAIPGGDLPQLPPLSWPVDDFVLVDSRPDADGAHYEVLGRWNLGMPSA